VFQKDKLNVIYKLVLYLKVKDIPKEAIL